MSLKFTTIPTKQLSESLTASGTSFKLNNIKGWDGTNLVAGDFGTTAYGVFRNANKTLLELFEFDPTTIASASITITRRGLDFTGDLTTEVSVNKLAWTRGDTYVDLGTDVPQFFQWMREYIDGIAIAGSPDASATVKGITKLSTAPALSTNPIAVGDNDTRLPTQAENDALAGTPGTPSSTNKFVTQAESVTAGETINGATTPVPVYQDKTDFEFYACDANDYTKMKFLGFAISNGTNGNAMNVQFSGIVSGFTGLTRGEKYYVQDAAGTIGTSIGTVEILVGVAISTTKILIMRGKRRAAGTTGSLGTASGSSAVTCGFRPSIIRLFATTPDGASFSMAKGVWTNGSLTGIYALYNEGTAGETGTGVTLYDETIGGANYMTFTITSVTDTGFTITWTETGTFANTSSICEWEAEGEL